MLKVLYELIKDFGTLGAVIGFGGTNLYFIWKIATNHLHHIAKDIKEAKDSIKNLESDMSKVKERVSKIEGKIE